MADNRYYGGITVGAAGFEIGAQAPVDSRFRVKNTEGLLELLTYEGLVSYNEADKKYYRFADGEWKALSVNTPAELEALIKTLIGTETTGAMEFKGATATLPENPGKGDMYKVSGEFAIGEETAKVGDTIVYNGEQWFLIPSGDDIEDTWRPVKVGENTLDQTETLEFVAGDNVTITEDAGKITISSSYEDTHYESKIVVGNESADVADESVLENGNVHFNLVEDGVVRSSHKIVGAGGITVTHAKAEGEDGVNVITIEAPEGAKYDLAAKTENGEATLSLAGTDNTEDKVAVVGDDAVAVTVADGKIKVTAHDTKYTGSEGAEVKVSVVDDGAISAELVEVGYSKLAQDVKDAFASSAENGAKAIADQNKIDIENITKDDGVIDTKIAAINFDPYLIETDIVTGETNGTIKVRDTEVAVHGLQDAAYTTVESLNATAQGYASDAQEAAEAEAARLDAALKSELEGTINGVAAQLANYVTNETYNAHTEAQDEVNADFEDRIEAVEAKFGEGTDTVEVMIAAAVGAEESRATGIEGGLRTDVNDALARVKAIEDAPYVTKSQLDEVDAKFGSYNTTEAQKTIDDAQDVRIKAIEDSYAKASEVEATYETKENVKKVADDLAAYEKSNDEALAAVKATADAAAVKADVDAALDARYTKTEADTKFETITNVALKADKSYVDEALGNKVNVSDYNNDKTTFATKTELNGVSDRVTVVEGILNDAGEGEELTKGLVSRVADLEKIDHDKLAEDASAVAVAAVLDGAPEKFDTLKEIAAWIADADTAEDAASLVTRVSALENSKDDYKDADATLKEELEGKIDAINDHSHSFVEDELNEIKAGDVAKWNAEIGAKELAGTKLDASTFTEYSNAHAGDYTNAQIDDAIDADVKVVSDALDAAKSELNTAIEDAKTAASNQDAVVLAEAQAYADQAKADAIADAEGKVNALAGNVYAKTETYTQAEVNAAIEAAVNAAMQWGSF